MTDGNFRSIRALKREVSADGGGTLGPLNVVAEVPAPADGAEPGAAGSGGVEVSGARR